MQRRPEYADPFASLERTLRQGLSEFANSALPRGEFEQYQTAQKELMADLKEAVKGLRETMEQMRADLPQNTPSRREFDDLRDALKDIKGQITTSQTNTQQGFATMTRWVGDNIRGVLIAIIGVLGGIIAQNAWHFLR